jgi:hypothetical protein
VLAAISSTILQELHGLSDDEARKLLVHHRFSLSAALTSLSESCGGEKKDE